MKERLKATNLYQRILLILMAAAFPLFFVIYQVVTAQPGIEYQGAFLRCEMQGEQAVYTGKVNGFQVRFAVSPEGKVEYTCDGVAQPAYTVVEDPTAIPAENEWSLDPAVLRGAEIRQGEKVLHRVAWSDSSGFYIMVDENGKTVGNMFAITFSSGGKTYDENGQEIQPSAHPGPADLVNMVFEPEIVHRGDWQFWFMGTLAALGCILLILFADELFRFNLSFQIRNADWAEPSEWEIATRYIGWTLLAFVAVASYCMGLAELV